MDVKQSDKKNLLLDAALKLFVDLGFHNTPTSKIARVAGVATGTLFYFFPTKDELIAALYKDVTRRTMEFVLSRVDDSKPPKEIIHAYYRATLEWAQTFPVEYQFIAHFTNSPYLQKVAKEEFDRNAAPLANQFSKAWKEGLIQRIDMDLVFILLHNHIAGVNDYLNLKNLSKPKTEKIMNETFELFWRMLN
jgi:AcrR family transcriptional regulator